MLGENRRIKARILVFILILYSVITLLPIIWVISLSLRSEREVFKVLLFPSSLHPENYIRALKEFRLLTLFKNSIIFTVGSVIPTLFFGALAAYAFAKIRFAFSNLIFFIILLGIMIPPGGVLVPLFVFMRNIGLYNSYPSLMLPYIAFGLPLAIFILRAFFVTLPTELIEAARIDGCTELGIFLRIMLPISRSALIAVAILVSIANWNEFLLALVFLGKESLQTLPVGIAAFCGQYVAPWQIIAAGVILATIPAFLGYVALQNQFIKGMAAGALKR
ncbi:carbohydrate ABC transporter permease [Candidatus Aerophobetes bacterium]|uniref:Carbohydrate ABC transporter permease n=1 Tax=Aerophobetes bacterium TaxID=2030807 RepID=A0A523WBV5_UNCAE|nr:MAG: carbohydrate ABC transporter permease [Candidatus Aerophobetes bacterium]